MSFPRHFCWSACSCSFITKTKLYLDITSYKNTGKKFRKKKKMVILPPNNHKIRNMVGGLIACQHTQRKI